jgi:hypothetical protein
VYLLRRDQARRRLGKVSREAIYTYISAKGDDARVAVAVVVVEGEECEREHSLAADDWVSRRELAVLLHHGSCVGLGGAPRRADAHHPVSGHQCGQIFSAPIPQPRSPITPTRPPTPPARTPLRGAPMHMTSYSLILARISASLKRWYSWGR